MSTSRPPVGNMHRDPHELDHKYGGIDRHDLYLAVQHGNVDRVKYLLERPSDVNKRTYDSGRTLLHVAAIVGHLEVVNLLLCYGADQKIRDESDWTALDHAAFRGHLDSARLIRNYGNHDQEIIELKDPYGDAFGNDITEQAKALRDDSKGRNISKLIVSMGPSSSRSNSKALSLHQEILDDDSGTQVFLSVSVSESPHDTRYIEFSKDVELINHQPLVFAVADPEQAQLVFRLIQSPAKGYGAHMNKGTGIALLSELTNGHLPGHHSLMRDFTIPIISESTPRCAATTTFNFTIAKPYHTPFETKLSRKQTPSYKYWSENSTTRIFGHRGTGANTTSRKTLQLGENTVDSLKYALTGGAEGVEFDVQLTKDFHPVIFHNFTIAEMGAEIPIHGLTKDQFLRANAVNSSSTRGMTGGAETRYNSRNSDSSSPATATATATTNAPRPRPRASSTDIYADDSTIADRMRTTPDFAAPGSIKGNLRGFSIQSPYATLEDFFRALPAGAAFNVEMKYPMCWEMEDKGLSRVAPEPNLYVDRVLDVVRALGPGRPVTFSSFSPDVCLLLAAKQRAYPVFFLTKAGHVAAGDDRAASLRQAVRFAKLWDLDGVVTAVTPLVQAPGLVGWVKRQGLFLATYGDGNDEPENARLLARLGVDLLIVNRVRLIVQSLKEDRGRTKA